MRTDDKTLTCTDCATSFVFTAGEQEMLRVRGCSDEPSRCPSCFRRAGRRQVRRDLPPTFKRALAEP